MAKSRSKVVSSPAGLTGEALASYEQGVSDEIQKLVASRGCEIQAIPVYCPVNGSDGLPAGYVTKIVVKVVAKAE